MNEMEAAALIVYLLAISHLVSELGVWGVLSQGEAFVQFLDWIPGCVKKMEFLSLP